MASKPSQGHKTYQKQLGKLLDENLIDLILFGSSVRGGSAADLDIAAVVRERKALEAIKKRVTAAVGRDADIHIIDITSLYSPLWLTLIKEGFSVRKQAFLFELYRLQPMVLYKYSLKTLSNVQKVQFERGIKRVLGSQGVFLTRSVVLVPITLKNAMTDFLKTWNIYYKTKEYELLPTLRKEEFV